MVGETLAQGDDRARGHRRLDHEDGVRTDFVGQLVDHRVDESKIRSSVVGFGRRQGEKDEARTGGRLDVGRVKGEEPPLDCLGQQLGEALLVDRHSPALEHGHPISIRLAQPHPVAEAGETGAGDEADVTGSDYCYVH